uniref:hypothetical protein n=1 Tax=Streptomyces anthocyanicus TaxID=68174 RepID=UPI002F90A01E
MRPLRRRVVAPGRPSRAPTVNRTILSFFAVVFVPYLCLAVTIGRRRTGERDFIAPVYGVHSPVKQPTDFSSSG